MPALVYVVDDEAVIATTLAAILQQSGFNAQAFLDPLQALEAAKTTCPDILISDVAMPHMNGIELGIQFKITHPTCRILLFSGQSTTTDLLEKAHKEGHDFHILTKPIHPTELLAALSRG